ncbi:MAG TPA: LysR substrate-binding domain-containing protein [Candidatus Angelobacter sp.]|nr:LysR substrate-binding domain-containing protein [Candidatus Angelobacter sp.]
MHPGVDSRLQYLAVILAEELNFSRAAKRAGMAQPAFSRQIRLLESFLGVRLFRRTSRSVELTEEGKIFVYEARKGLHYSARAVELASKGTNGPSTLTIGYPSFFDPHTILEGLARVSLPGLSVAAQSSSSAQIAANISNGIFDCGIVVLPQEYPELAEFRKLHLVDDPLRANIRKDHPLAKKRPLELSDLKDQPLIFIAREQNPALHSWLERRCQRYKFTPLIVQEARNLHEYAAMVSHAASIGLMPGFSRIPHPDFLPENIVVRDFRDPTLTVEVAMIFGERFNSAYLRSFITAVTKLRDEYRAKRHSPEGP